MYSGFNFGLSDYDWCVSFLVSGKLCMCMVILVWFCSRLGDLGLSLSVWLSLVVVFG